MEVAVLEDKAPRHQKISYSVTIFGNLTKHALVGESCNNRVYNREIVLGLG